VTYTINAKSGIQSGDTVSAQATIVFDNQPPLSTSTITNTFDVSTPTSSVQALPKQTANTTFEVNWSGTDDPKSSGIANYTILVSTDGGPATAWLTNTTQTNALFTGADGDSYAFSSIATSNAGNVEAQHATPDATVEVGTLAPTGLALTPASDSGASHTDNITNVTTPVVTGLADAGASVTLYDGSTVVGSGVADAATGQWSIETAALAEGVHVLTATAVNTTGVVSASSAALDVTIDTVAPVISISAVLGAVNQTNRTISGSASVSAAGDAVTIYDGTTSVGSTSVGADGSWSTTITLASSGAHSITAAVADIAGNIGVSGAVVVALQLSVTVAQYQANRAALDAQGQIQIADAAANVEAAFDTLNGDANIASIALTDGGTPTLNLTVAQALNDTIALGKITGAHTLAVIDSATHIEALTSAGISALKSNGVASISASDGGVALSIANALAFAGAGYSISVSAGQSASVADTATNIAAITRAQADALKAAGYASLSSTTGAVALSAAAALILSGDGLKVTGGAVTVSDAAAALAALTSAQVSALKATGYGFGAVDTAADIEMLTPAQIAMLGAEGASITATDASVVLSVAEAVAYSQAGLAIHVPAGETVGVTDTAANIAANLGALNASSIASITIADSEPVSVTLGALKTDAAAIGKLVNADGAPYELAVANPAGNVTSVAPAVVEKGQTTVVGQLSSTLTGLGLPLTLKQTGGTPGALSFATDGSGNILYTAASAVAASSVDAVSYGIVDAHNDLLATGAANVQLDAGPSINAAAPVKVGHGQIVAIGTVTPGIAGDTLTLTQTAGEGAIGLHGSTIQYTAPGVVAAGQSDQIGYSLQDQHADATASAIAKLLLDSGPTAASASITVGHNQSFDETAFVNSLIAPGLAGDTETIVAVGAHAKLIGSTVTYQSPASGTDSFSYTAEDQLADTATGTVSVTVDPGPTPGAVAPTVQFGQSVDLTSAILAAAKPGLGGDILSIVADNTTGVLGVVTLANGDLTYAASGASLASASSSGSAIDTFGYTISDQFGDLANGVVSVTVNNPVTVINGPPYGGAIQGIAGNETINAYGYNNTIYANGGSGAINAGQGNAIVYAGSGSLTIYLAGYYDVVSGGDGTDMVSGSSGNATVTLGNGVDKVTVGGYGNIASLGNGNDAVNLGLGSGQLTLGSGANTIVIAGYGNTVTVGGGANTLTGGDGNDTLTFGNGNNTITAGGYNNVIKVGQGNNSIVAGAGNDSVTAGNGNNVIILAGYGDTVSVGSGTNTIGGGAGTDTVTVGGGTATMDLYGWSDLVTMNGGATATINDHGGGLGIKVGSAADHLLINGVSVDTSAWIDLLSPSMGYASASAAYNALQSDGQGGSLLTLSGGGAIDIAGVAPTRLSASNFRIG
jgi:hypothetical protein